MKAMKDKLVFVPLIITVLLIIGIAVLITGQPNEIKIYTGSELIRFLEEDAGDASKKATLYADLALGKAVLPPALACELDGNGHTLTVKDIGTPWLFGTVTETGAVRNIVINGKMGGTDSRVTAGITEKNLGSIENCVIKADFSGGGFVNGICHTNHGNVANCFVRSNGMGDKERGFIWNPICAENHGAVKDCYYSVGSTDGEDTVGAYISGEEMKVGELPDALNGYAENDPRLVGWQTDEKGYPTLKSDTGSKSASVFAGGRENFLACMVILIIAVPIFTIVYVDKQKKKVIYKK